MQTTGKDRLCTGIFFILLVLYNKNPKSTHRVADLMPDQQLLLPLGAQPGPVLPRRAALARFQLFHAHLATVLPSGRTGGA